MSDGHWVETPMFIMRRDCLNRATAAWSAGRFLEIGAGTGNMTRAFLERGFDGVCYDLGGDTREALRRNLAPFGTQVDVIDDLDEATPGSFDYVFAFEVLEHIEADGDALRAWTRFLKPGGKLLLSVPAHARKYSDEDRSVGHYRRYEKAQLAGLIGSAGLADLRVRSYGFPITVLTRRGNELLTRAKAMAYDEDQTPEALSIRSGVQRSEASIRIAKILNRRTLAPFALLQRLFFDSDLGDGYVAHAELPGPISAR